MSGQRWVLALPVAQSAIRPSLQPLPTSHFSLHLALSTWHLALYLSSQLAFFIAIGRAYAFAGLCALLVSAFL
jgi:hypothetical protein